MSTNSSNTPYTTFFYMMTVSFVIMYAVMFLNAYSLDHVLLSYTRTYMTILMICPMAISMLLFKWKMYPNKKLNISIILVSMLLFGFTLFSLRSQLFIKDVQYMKAMIPHHSSAILVSKNAKLEDPKVQELAKAIIEAQEKEIAQMKAAISRLQKQKE